MPVKWGDTKSSSISEPTRIDVYGFSGQQGDQLVMPVAIGSTGQGGFNMRVRLFDSNSLLKLDVTTTSAKEIQYVLPMTGTYKLWINAQDNVTTGDYAFTLQRYNSPGNVIPVTFGETKSGDILPPTKIAVYLINANTGDDLIIPLKTTASGQGGTYQTRLRLFDDKNTLILDQATDGTGAVKEIRYSVASGGVFYAWVTAMSIGQTGSYQFTLSDNLLSNVTAAPIFLDPTNNGQVSIGYDLQRDANVKIDLYKATLDFDDLVESTFPGVFHKAFYQNIFTGTCPKGHCTFVWNGKDAQGNSFSENAYVYTITADDMTGARHGSFDPEYVRGGVTILNNHLTLPNADPYKGEMTSVSYDLAAPSWVTLRIVRLSMSLEGSMRDLLISAPRDMANNSEMWDGHDNKGNVVPADKYTMYGAATLLPSNAIVVQKKNIVAVPYLQIDPYAFYPEYGELTNIKYTISKDAAVTLEVKNSAGTTVRLLLNAISQTAGTYSFLWDGRDGAGHPIGNAGNYHIVLTAVDNSGAIVTRNINALLFK